jgi:hypothetical protein
MPMPIFAKSLTLEQALLERFDLFGMKLKDRPTVATDHVIVVMLIALIGLIDGATLGIGERLTKDFRFAEHFEISIHGRSTDARKPGHHLLHQLLSTEMGSGLKKKLQNLNPLLTSLELMFCKVSVEAVFPNSTKLGRTPRMKLL